MFIKENYIDLVKKYTPLILFYWLVALVILNASSYIREAISLFDNITTLIYDAPLLLQRFKCFYEKNWTVLVKNEGKRQSCRLLPCIVFLMLILSHERWSFWFGNPSQTNDRTRSFQLSHKLGNATNIRNLWPKTCCQLSYQAYRRIFSQALIDFIGSD